MNLIYHVINRGNKRQDVFHKTEDFAAFRLTNATGLLCGTAPWIGRLANKFDLDLTIRPRRSGYLLSGCVPAEPDSLSPDDGSGTIWPCYNQASKQRTRRR